MPGSTIPEVSQLPTL